ncbi:MAG: P-loop NTPase [Acidimicrobiia bacterium]|nr:P-loop NTPase [Acidimicrobiia bacterium]
MKPLRVVTCAPGADWEAALVTAAARGRVPVEIISRCLELGELEAAIRAGIEATTPLDAVLVGAGLAWIDTVAVQDLRRTGSVVVAVTTPEGGPADVEHLGADAVITGRVDAGTFVAGLVDALVPVSRRGVGVGPASEAGRVIVIWSAKGAPGRTTLAVSLAWELARLGARTRLVDLDTYGPAVGILLGLPETPTIVQLAQRLASGDTSALDCLHRPCRDLGVAIGASRPDAWLDLPDHAVRLTLGTLAADAAVVVADVDDCVEDDEELRLGSRPWRRNQATLAALAAADVVLVPVVCDPVSVHATVRSVARLRRDDSVWAGRAPRVLAVTSRVASGRVAADVEAFLRDADIETVLRLPHDPRTVTRSRWEGRAAVELAPRSAYGRAVSGVAKAMRGELGAAACLRGRGEVPA